MRRYSTSNVYSDIDLQVFPGTGALSPANYPLDHTTEYYSPGGNVQQTVDQSKQRKETGGLAQRIRAKLRIN